MLVQGLAIGFERGQTRAIHKLSARGVARQKDSGLLEGFTDRRGAERAHRVCPVFATIDEVIQIRVVVALVDLAARKHQSTGHEIDLVMTLDHEDLYAVRAVAHEQYRRRR